MSDAPTIAQILSDPRAATHVALDYCNEQMARCLDRVDALEAENAALREFVAAADALADFEAEHPAGLWPITVIADLDARQQAFVQARQRLATEFGIELPGAEAER